MLKHLVASLMLSAATVTLSAQSGPPSGAPTTLPAQRTITLVGCVQTDAARAEWFTLSDRNTGTTYHLTGAKVRAYVWRNVRIVGGLVPSPNIAAQAGAIDQAKAAMAYQGANPPGTGNVDLIEFSVTRVRRLTGSCAPKPDR